MPIEHDSIVRVLMRDRPRLLANVWAIVRDHHAAKTSFKEDSVLAVHKSSEIDDEEHFGRWLRTALRYKAMILLRVLEILARYFPYSTKIRKGFTKPSSPDGIRNLTESSRNRLPDHFFKSSSEN